jgi:hypothetical protein
MDSSMKARMMMLMAVSMAGMTGNSRNTRFSEAEILNSEPVKKPIPNGCKEYTFYGHTVVALNEKSAIKKCKKLADLTNNKH